MIQRVIINIAADSTIDMPMVLANYAEECEATIEFSRYYTFGDQITSCVVLTGQWALPQQAEKVSRRLRKQGVRVTVTSVDDKEPPRRKKAVSAKIIPLTVQAVAENTTDVMKELLEFFILRKMKIVDLYSEAYSTSHSDTEMTTIGFTVLFDSELSLSVLREEFLEFCDQINVDGLLEIEKS